MKSKAYRINKVDESTVLVLSTSYLNPTDQISSIEKDLLKKGFSGKVFFDFLLTNGNSKQRFFETSFENGSMNITKLKNLSNQVDTIKAISKKFYIQHYELVEQSEILSKATKFLVKQGRI
jgi:hypothetical protein